MDYTNPNENLNPNDTIQDAFLYEIDQTIVTGDPKYIINAIKKYKNNIDNSYIVMATNVLNSLLEETLEEMEI